MAAGGRLADGRGEDERSGGGAVSGGLAGGVGDLEPGEQGGHGQDPEHGALRSGQGHGAAPGPGLPGVPDQDAKARAVDERQPAEVNDAARRPLPADVPQAGLQGRGVQDIQVATQADDATIAKDASATANQTATTTTTTTTTPTATSSTATTTTTTTTRTTVTQSGHSTTVTTTSTVSAPGQTTSISNRTTNVHATNVAPAASTEAHSGGGLPWWGWLLIALGVGAIAILMFTVGRDRGRSGGSGTGTGGAAGTGSLPPPAAGDTTPEGPSPSDR